jgi:hypothetical protein
MRRRRFPNRVDILVLVVAMAIYYVGELELLKCCNTGVFGGNFVEGPSWLSVAALVVPQLPTIAIYWIADQRADQVDWGYWRPDSSLIAVAITFSAKTQILMLWNALWWGLLAVATFRLYAWFTPCYDWLFHSGKREERGFEVVGSAGELREERPVAARKSAKRRRE